MKSTLFLLAVSATVHTDSLPRDQDLQSQIVTVEPRSVVQVDISSKVTHQLRAPVIPGFIPTFFDDFSGLPGSLPSRENWIINIGTQYPGGSERWGNIENQYYTDSTDNLRITSDGTLEFVPLLDVPGTGETGNWTSGRIETNRTDFAAVAGGQLYVETRVKVGAGIPSQQAGMWCAFWALGAIFRGHHSNWPEASEWDILEVLGGNDMLYSTLHCDVVPVGACNEYEGLRNEGVPYSKHDWHRLGFLVDRSMTGEGGLGTWEDESVNWSLDGKDVWRVTGKDVGKYAAWQQIAHNGHFLILNVAVGGISPGWPTNATVGGPESGMQVDYVGVWNSLIRK